MTERAASPREGWTDPLDSRGHRRNEFVPENFHEESHPGKSSSAAWGEPGYVDPDREHERLPLGTRYWQGFAREASSPKNRPKSAGILRFLRRLLGLSE